MKREDFLKAYKCADSEGRADMRDAASESLLKAYDGVDDDEGGDDGEGDEGDEDLRKSLSTEQLDALMDQLDAHGGDGDGGGAGGLDLLDGTPLAKSMEGFEGVDPDGEDVVDASVVLQNIEGHLGGANGQLTMLRKGMVALGRRNSALSKAALEQRALVKALRADVGALLDQNNAIAAALRLPVTTSRAPMPKGSVLLKTASDEAAEGTAGPADQYGRMLKSMASAQALGDTGRVATLNRHLVAASRGQLTAGELDALKV